MSTPRSASFQSSDHHVFQLFVQKFFAGFFPGGVGTSTKSASTPAGLKSFDLAVLDGSEQPLDAFGGIGAMRKNLFERILARFLPRQLRCGV